MTPSKLQNKSLLGLLWPLLTLALLVSGCATNSLLPEPASAPQPVVIPELVQEARQPTPPAICSPSCSEGLTRLRKELLDSLTQPTSPVKPASGSTTL